MQVGKYLICTYVLANHRYLGDRMTLTWHSAALSPGYSLYYVVCVCGGRSECGVCGYGVAPRLARVAESGTICYVHVQYI